jgi:hypothetical protein
MKIVAAYLCGKSSGNRMAEEEPALKEAKRFSG